MHDDYGCRIVYSKFTEAQCEEIHQDDSLNNHPSCSEINAMHRCVLVSWLIESFIILTLYSLCQAPKPPYQIYYYIIFAVLGFIAPLLIIVISYILILWSIVKSQVRIFFFEDSIQFKIRLGRLGQSNKETDTHVNLMIGSLFLTAIILIGPYIIYMFVLVSKFLG